MRSTKTIKKKLSLGKNWTNYIIDQNDAGRSNMPD